MLSLRFEVAAHIEVDAVVVAVPKGMVDEKVLAGDVRPPGATRSASCRKETSRRFFPDWISTRKMPSFSGAAAFLGSSRRRRDTRSRGEAAPNGRS